MIERDDEYKIRSVDLGPPEVTVRMADPKTDEEIGTLGITWKPRWFGRWGKATPRVIFTGDVERSAKQLFEFMIPFAASYGVQCCRD